MRQAYFHQKGYSPYLTKTEIRIDFFKKEADFNAYSYVPTIQRVRLMDFTIPFHFSQYCFVVRYPEAESRLYGPIRPYQKLVTTFRRSLDNTTAIKIYIHFISFAGLDCSVDFCFSYYHFFRCFLKV